MVVVDPVLDDPAPVAGAAIAGVPIAGVPIAGVPIAGVPIAGASTAATMGFDELGDSTGVSRCAITMAGKTALVGLESDGINRMLTPSPEDLFGSESETFVPASDDTAVVALDVALDVAFDAAVFADPEGPDPGPTREPDCTRGRLGKLGSDGGNRGASTLGNGAIDCTAKLGAGVAEAGLVAIGETTFEPGTIRIPTARTAGTRAISVGFVR